MSIIGTRPPLISETNLYELHHGNWDVLRPAKIVEGLEPISENLLDKLNEEAQNMIEKMRCAV